MNYSTEAQTTDVDYTTRRHPPSCGTKNEVQPCARRGIYMARVHLIHQMGYGLRWFLDVFDEDGSKSRLMKYSNFKHSKTGWKQFRREMKRIGLEFPPESNREYTGKTVAKVCRKWWYLIQVNTGNDHTAVVFLREATFREQYRYSCLERAKSS